MLLLVQKDYIKTTLKILSSKIIAIVRLVDVANIIWVLNFLKQCQKVWHYWLKDKMKTVLTEPPSKWKINWVQKK